MRRRLEAFSPRVLTWVAALPAWTTDLASRLGLSSGHGPVDELIGRLESAGLVETSEILGSDGRLVRAFWLRATVRPQLGGYLRKARPGQVDQDLDDLAAAVAAQDLGAPAPGSLSSAGWLMIVRKFRPDSSGLRLISEIDRLLAKAQLVEATGLVAAARGLGELASDTLLDSARRAQWRIDRAFRIEQDTEQLRYYRRRPVIEQAIDDLMRESGPNWALHLLGDGGVGKTMLIRYLASGRFAADRRGQPFLVARADFDHLDARYPDQRPAELLLALAGELAAFTRTRDQYRRYRHFQDAADLLHEQLAGRGQPRLARAELLADAAGRFSDLVQRLDTPVLLILDTCEELAKLYAPGMPAPAIEQTFRLLEAVHDNAGQVRVLLAGRRWLVPSDDPRQRATGPLLYPRPYLRVLPVAGFTREEADAYIDARERIQLQGHPDATRLPAALRAALLDRSRIGLGGQGSYSPFELAAYTEWASSDPDLDADALRSAPGDPYVEWRIIGRLGHDPVRAALGIAAELGRFDRTLVTPALLRAGIDPGTVFDGLAAQEWVNVLSLGDNGLPRVIEIDEHLLDRIRAVTAASPSQFPVDRAALGRDAEDIIARTPLGELPAESVSAAIRLLPLAAAGRLWQRIEERVVDERAWGWAAQVTTRIGAIELARAEEAGPGSPTILAAIIATQAAAELHTRPGPVVARLWSEVERIAPRHPDAESGAVLAMRARLGLVAAGDRPGNAVLTEALSANAGRRESLTGAILAAASSCVDRGERLPEEIAVFLADVGWGDGLAGASALLASSLLWLWAGDGVRASLLADRSIRTAERAEAEEHAGAQPELGRAGWADWAAPARLADRCRLARVTIAWRCGDALDSVPWAAWRSMALDHLSDIDAERLAAATVRFELAHRVCAGDELERAGQTDQYWPRKLPSDRPSSSWLHRQVGPLVTELAEAWGVLRKPDTAARLLHERLEEAVAAGDDPDTIEACELSLLRLCRRQRSTEFFSSVDRLSEAGTPRPRAEAWLVRALVRGERPKDPAQAGSWSAWWCCQDAASLTELAGPPPVPSADAPATDRAEFNVFFPDQDPASPALASRAAGGAAGEPENFDPETELRLGRTLTLPPGSAGRASVAAAELTALRLPARAVEPLLAAARQLREAGDERGADEAEILAGLAAARARDEVAARSIWFRLAGGPDGELTHLAGGWPFRAAALSFYVTGQPAITLPGSPELMLPTAGRNVVRQAITSLTSESSGEVAALSGSVAGLAAAAAIVVGTDEISVVIVAALVVFARLFAIVLPNRFIAARQIEVGWEPSSRPPVVRVRAVPSRGARDLNGLSPATIAGGLAGRWPYWSMFVPWRGKWSQSSLASNRPSFNLDGLSLPRRSSRRHLAFIAVTTEDPSCLTLPWEQWLGRSLPPARRSSLLWYRCVPGRRPELSGKRWRRAGVIYRGPRELAAPGQRTQADDNAYGLKLLHLTGTPVPTRGGFRMRIADAPSAAPAVSEFAAESEYAGPSSRGTDSAEDLLNFSRFPLRETALAVLQADPVDDGPQPLADLRAGFAECARDLLAGGVGAVLVIPPLPDELAREVVQAIGKAVADRRRAATPMTMLSLLAQLKAMVADAESAADFGAPTPDQPDRPELDVLLFLRARASRQDRELAPTTS
jgi:hypothetical protein